ncbi:hypothetical protein, partial [uncultured Lamprocystis sp.]
GHELLGDDSPGLCPNPVQETCSRLKAGVSIFCAGCPLSWEMAGRRATAAMIVIPATAITGIYPQMSQMSQMKKNICVHL